MNGKRSVNVTQSDASRTKETKKSIEVTVTFRARRVIDGVA